MFVSMRRRMVSPRPGVVPATGGRRVSRAAALVLMGVLIVGVAACGAGAQPRFARPSDQQLLAVLSEGRVQSAQWRVEAVRQGGRTCLQDVVETNAMNLECDFVVDGQLPVNLGVVGNRDLLFIDGLVSRQVSRLTVISSRRPYRTDLKLVIVDGVPDGRYYGAAVRPNDILDLIAYDETGNAIYSGANKILGTRDGS